MQCSEGQWQVRVQGSRPPARGHHLPRGESPGVGSQLSGDAHAARDASGAWRMVGRRGGEEGGSEGRRVRGCEAMVNRRREEEPGGESEGTF